MVIESQESMDRMSELRTKSTTIKLPSLLVDNLVISDDVDASQPDDTQISSALLQTSYLPRFPTSFTPLAKKRSISDTTDSTMPSNSEMTLKKMCHSETKV